MKRIVFIVILLLSFAQHGYSLGPIYSDTLICIGSVYTCTIEATGGTWESSDTAIGKINIATGKLEGISAGALTITYHLASISVIRRVNVREGVTPIIIGSGEVCVGSTLAITDTTAGGKWSSLYSYAASVDTAGIVTGRREDTYVVSYTLPNGCYDTATITVHTPGGTITNGAYFCVGRPSYCKATEPWGTWSCADTTLATILTLDSVMAGVVGLVAGPVSFLYTVMNVCGLHTVRHNMYIGQLGCWVGVPNTTLQPCKMNVYPNPVQTVLTVSTDEPINSVAVMSIAGYSVITQHESTNEAQIDVSSLAPGIYFIKINENAVQRFIKQ